MLLSIILPVFNNASSIKEAIESILEQTSPNWELIIINDGSIDNSLQIVQNFSKTDSRIKIISNRKNFGPSITRNQGIELAAGDYIGFLDADDTYETSYVEIMLQKAVKYDAEIVWCQYIEKKSPDDKGIKIKNQITKEICYNNKEALNFFYNKIPGIGPLWNKIYSKTFINRSFLRMNTERVRGEDWEFNLFAFSNVNKLILTEDFLYNYIHQNNNSIISNFRKSDYNMIWRSIELLTLINNIYNLGYNSKTIYNTTCHHFMETIYRSINSSSFSYQGLKTIFKEERFQNFIHNININNLPRTYKVLCFLLRNNFWGSAYCFSKLINNYLK